MVSFAEKLRQAKAGLAQRNADPLLNQIGSIVRGMEAIGTAPLLDLLGLPKTTGNGRRIARTMRSLGFVPIKSRRLMPGGYRDSVTRGWCRPIRDPNQQMEPRRAACVTPSRSHDVAAGTVGGVK